MDGWLEPGSADGFLAPLTETVYRDASLLVLPRASGGNGNLALAVAAFREGSVAIGGHAPGEATVSTILSLRALYASGVAKTLHIDRDTLVIKRGDGFIVAYNRSQASRTLAIGTGLATTVLQPLFGSATVLNTDNNGNTTITLPAGSWMAWAGEITPRPEVTFITPVTGSVLASRSYLVSLGVNRPTTMLQIRIDRGPWCTATAAGTGFTYQWSGVEAGFHRLEARAQSASGGWGPLAVCTLTSTAAPQDNGYLLTLETDSPRHRNRLRVYVNNTYLPLVSGSTVTGGRYQYRLDPTALIAAIRQGSIQLLDTGRDNSFPVYNLTLLENGVAVASWPGPHDPTREGLSFAYDLDRERPDARIVFPLQGTVWNSTNLQVRVQTGDIRDAVVVIVNGTNQYPCVYADGQFTALVTGLSNGAYSIAARVTDRNGITRGTPERSITCDVSALLSRYILSWEGYDWSIPQEVRLLINGNPVEYTASGAPTGEGIRTERAWATYTLDVSVAISGFESGTIRFLDAYGFNRNLLKKITLSGPGVKAGQWQEVALDIPGSGLQYNYLLKRNDSLIVGLAASPAAFSPNGDGKKETSCISFGCTNKQNTKYEVRILSPSGESVVSWDGKIKHSIPVSLVWDGRGRGGSNACPDGSYTIQVAFPHLSQYSNSVARVPLVLDTTPPVAITNLQTAQGLTNIALTWSAGGQDDTVAYRITRYPAFPGGVSKEVPATGTPVFWDRGLAEGVRYTYTVVPRDRADNEGAAASTCFLYGQLEKVIQADKETTITFKDITLVFPSGAVVTNTTIKIREVTNVAAIGSFKSASRIYTFEPDGLQFAKPGLLTMRYERARIRRGFVDKHVHAFTWNGKSKPVNLYRVSIDSNTCEIKSKMFHFSSIGAGVLDLPSQPQAGGGVKTDLSKLAKANPLAGMNIIGAPSVNNSGDLTASYPIPVPAGPGGIKPNVALIYSSSGGMGVCGKGWSLSAGGVIMRIHKQGRGLPYNQQGLYKYLFNGQEMVKVAPDTYMCRSVDGQVSVIKYRYNGQNFYWSVTDNKGNRTIYGDRNHTYPTKAYLNVARQPNFWYLSEFIDRNGNTIHYSYIQDENVLYLSEIAYNNNLQKIKLEWLPALKKRIQYSFGFKQVYKKSLSIIAIYRQGVELSKYQLEYGSADKEINSFILQKVKQLNGNDVVNEAVFGYSKSAHRSFTTNTSYIFPERHLWPIISTNREPSKKGLDMGVRFVDFNGDGLIDVVKAGGTLVEVWTNSGRNWVKFVGLELTNSIFLKKTGGDNPGSYSMYSVDLTSFDVDGDGKKDLVDLKGVVVTNTNNPGGHYEEVIVKRIFPWYRWVTTYSSLGGFVIQQPKEEIWKTLYFKDTWGRGFGQPTELKGVNRKYITHKNGEKSYVVDLLNTQNGYYYQFQERGTYGQFVGWNHIKTISTSELTAYLVGGKIDHGHRLIDVNGDGRIDVLVAREGREKSVLLNTGLGWIKGGSSFHSPVDFSDSRGIGNQKVLFADFNGDGLTDIIENASVFLSTGSGFVYSTGTYGMNFPVWLIPLPGDRNDPGIRFTDLNNDGLSDVIQLHYKQVPGANYSTVTTYNRRSWLNNGKVLSWEELKMPGDVPPYNSAISYEEGSGDQYQHSITAAILDYNGDGYPDIQYFKPWNSGVSGQALINAGNNQYKISTGWGSAAGLIKFRNGEYGHRFVDINGDGCTDIIADNGKKVYINSYSKGLLLTNINNGVGGRYAVSYTNSCNNVGAPFKKRLVASISQKDTVSGFTGITKYLFADGNYSHQENTFLGYGTIITVDGAGNRTISRNHNSNIWFAGRNYLKEVQDPVGNLISKTTTEWNVKTLYVYSSPVIATYPARTTQYAYSGTGTNSLYSTAKEYTFENKGIDGLVPLTEKTTIGTRIILKTIPEYTTVEINGRTLYLPGSSETKIGDTLTALEKFSYDNKGQVIKKEVKDLAKDRWLATQITYDAYGNRVQVTDPRGNSVSYNYDSQFHVVPISKTEALITGQSFATTMTYDPLFLRLDTSVDAYGNQIKYEYDTLNRPTTVKWNGTNFITISYGRDGERTSSTATTFFESGRGIQSVSHADGFGKTIQTKEQKLVNGSLQYISSGRFQRDVLGRVIKQGESYLSSNTDFDLLSAPWGMYSTSEYDRMGRVKEAKTFSASGAELYATSTAYTLTPTESRVTVTDPKGRKTTTVKDIYGQVSSVIEDDGGQNITTTYIYDELGRLSTVKENGDQLVTTITYDAAGRKTGMSTPDSGSWTYTYNEFGDMTTQKDANNNSTSYTYDTAGRLSAVQYQDGKTTSYQYGTSGSGRGRLVAINSSGYTNTLEYDTLGSVVKETRNLESGSYVMRYSHTLSGQQKQITYPNGNQVHYTYNSTGDLIKVGNTTGGNQYIKNIQYNKDGQRTGITYGNGVTTSYTYDPAKKAIRSIITKKADNTTQQHLSYGFDKAGNISAITNVAQGGRTIYAYDTLDRMTTATASGFTNTALNFDSSYSFNRNGGLLSRPDVSSCTYNTGTHRLSTAGRFTLSYDANGNVTQRTESVGSDPQPMLLHYNCRNVLSDITNAHSGDGGGVWVRFVYDSSGQRLRKYSSLGNDFRYINGYYAEKRYDNDAVRITNQHIYAGKERVCTLVNGSAHFIHRDQINSGGLITTNGGSVTDRVAFAPYGTVIYQQNSGVTNGIEEKFTGQILDEETGLYYYNARYYDPTIGVFLAADSIVPDAYSSQSLNRYMYVVGNPVVYSDPTGHANTAETLSGGWSPPPGYHGCYSSWFNQMGWSFQDFLGARFYYSGGQMVATGTTSGSYVSSWGYGNTGSVGFGYSGDGSLLYSASQLVQNQDYNNMLYSIVFDSITPKKTEQWDDSFKYYYSDFSKNETYSISKGYFFPNIGYTKGAFSKPTIGGSISSRFGPRHLVINGVSYPMHYGNDIVNFYPALGDGYIFPAAGGKAKVNLNHPGYGKRIIITHANGVETHYNHLSQVFIQNGQTVSRGMIIGLEGSTGLVTGNHLDIELSLNGILVDFTRYMIGSY